MDPVHILMVPVHGPGPQRGPMDQGSMFCTFPLKRVLAEGSYVINGEIIKWRCKG